MVLLRFSAFWCGTILFGSVLLEQKGASSMSMLKLRRLCKFCDVESTSCTGTGSCMTDCGITSICPHPDDVCVSIWRKKVDNVTIDTICHNPALKLHGLMLEDYNNSKCEMRERNGMGSQFFICSCSEDECNDHMFFPPLASSMTKLKLRRLCKFCDVESTSCKGTGSCMTDCSITSICPHQEDVCVSIWRKKDDNVTIDTICHNPAHKLHGLVLEDYNNSKCEMRERNGMGSQFFICSCSEDECNDNIFFPP